MIGIDDISDPIPPVTHHQASQSLPNRLPNLPTSCRLEQPAYSEQNGNHVGTISDSSSSSSSSDSDSDEDNDNHPNNRPYGTSSAPAKTNGYLNGTAPKIDTHLLNDDLCLSESGSESE